MARLSHALDEERQYQWMHVALRLARRAYRYDEVPVGAVIYDHANRRLAVAHNRVETCRDPLAHAEICAIQRACRRLASKFLTDCTLVTTLEPCSLCAAAIREARISTLVFGVEDKKGGSILNGIRLYQQAHIRPPPTVYGPLEIEECSELLRAFFRARR